MHRPRVAERLLPLMTPPPRESHTMSVTQRSKRRGEPRWLTPVQQRAWLAYIRVELRMNYEMHRQLLADTGLSLSDYHVLVALSNAPHARMRVADLAAQIGWERSRVSHH